MVSVQRRDSSLCHECIIILYLVSSVLWLSLFNLDWFKLFDGLPCWHPVGMTRWVLLNDRHSLQHCGPVQRRLCLCLCLRIILGKNYKIQLHVKRNSVLMIYSCTSCGHIFWRERCIQLPSVGAPHLYSCHRCWQRFWSDCQDEGHVKKDR